jgi:polyphosphate kinase 2 (PPK2 family)
MANPSKHWKFSARDVDQRRRWGGYMRAYQEAIRATTTGDAPWFVVPADRKWWAGAVISTVMVEALEGLGLRYPRLTAEERRQMREIADTLGGPAAG